MASGDTALWLHNKLGSTDDLWSGRTICSQLSKERLISIQECFHTLQPHVKVKLMLSFLHLPRRNTEVWKVEMDEILSMAMMDTDPWVCMVAEMLQSFPSTGSLNLSLEENSQTFAEVLSDLKKCVKKTADIRMLPIECQFLNKTALSNAAGQPPQPVKHFALKRKPKSATLRAELLQKSSEAAANKKNNVSNSVPIKMRSFLKKVDDTTPLKGLPSRSPSTPGFRAAGAGFGRINNTPLSTAPLSSNRPTSANRKEGKIKFLDITEVPVGSKEAKRRKKMAEIEALEQQKKEKEAALSAAAAATPTTTVTSYTPDYAAGLVAPATPKIPTPAAGTSTAALSTPTPTYVPAASTRLPTQPAAATTVPSTVSVTLSASTQAARQNLQQQLQQQLGQSQIRTQMIVTQPQTVILQPSTTLQQVVTQQQAAVLTTTTPQQQVQPQQQAQVQLQPQQAVATQAATATPTAVGGPVKKGLSLTREQMLEAQEMFKTSNKVTRPEKALILGFMAGSRDNPCPQQGDILNIRLSETEETVQQTDGVQKRMIADTYFQMNYATGEWKRFKKFREIGAS